MLIIFNCSSEEGGKWEREKNLNWLALQRHELAHQAADIQPGANSWR